MFNLVLVVDVDLEVICMVDLLIVNEYEVVLVVFVLGLMIFCFEDDFDVVLCELLNFGCCSVVIILGLVGCIVGGLEGFDVVVVVIVKVVDIVGVGDVFVGVLVVELVCGCIFVEGCCFVIVVVILMVIKLGV